MTTSDSAARAMIPEPTRTGARGRHAPAGGARQPHLPAGALPGRSRPRTTGTWRWPTPCATGCWSAGSRRRRPTPARDVKVVCYLSAEFLIGPQLGNNLVNLGIEAGRARGDAPRSAWTSTTLLAQEEEPGLGNGGLGRLAACYLDSLATLEMPGHRLRHPLRVRHLRPGDPRRLAGRDHRQVAALGQPLGDRPARRCATTSSFGGHTEHVRRRATGATACAGCRTHEVKGVAYDTPILGYRVDTCNMLRLWKRRGRRVVRLPGLQRRRLLRRGRARRSLSETITKVLYPNDEPEVGKRLRLAQQYFFVSCSLQDMLRTARADRASRSTRFPEQVRRAAQRHASRRSPSPS